MPPLESPSLKFFWVRPLPPPPSAFWPFVFTPVSTEEIVDRASGSVPSKAVVSPIFTNSNPCSEALYSCSYPPLLTVLQNMMFTEKEINLRPLLLFPLNGAGWFGRDVVHHPIYAPDCVADLGRHVPKEVWFERIPIRSHPIRRRYSSESHHVRMRALVPLNACKAFYFE
jgi:hypothetical protein